MPRNATVLVGACIAACVAAPAGATEYCVTCEGPPALYRCVIDGLPEGPGNDPRASVYCISEMARQGKHERCAVSRGAPFPCPGLTTLVQPQGGGKPEVAMPPHPEPDAHPVPMPPDVTPATEPADVPAEPAPAKVPRTVEELAGQTMRQSKEGFEKAGEAIGGTAKKAGSAIGKAASNTWTCIASLFTSCGGGEEAETEPAPVD